MRGLRAKAVWFFNYFKFERDYDVKSKSPCFLLYKNVNVNRNETESKMERDEPYASGHIRIAN